MTAVALSLPWPPSVNVYWRHVVMGKRAATILSEDARRYRRSVGQAVLDSHVARGQLTGKLAVLIEVFPPDRRDRDLDNLPKGILDSLKHAGVIRDDCDIDDLRIVRRSIVRGGLIQIAITEIAGEATESADLFGAGVSA